MGTKPTLFVEFAVEAASAADEVAWLVKVVIGRSKRRPRLPTVSSLEHWLCLYRRHRQVRDKLGGLVLEGCGVTASEVVDHLRAVSRMTEEEVRRELKKLLEDDAETFEEAWALGRRVPFPPEEAELRAMVREIDADGRVGIEEGEPFDLLARSAEGQFALRVCLPCIVLHKTSPGRLLWEARKGCEESLERLLAIDKSVLGDPVIARHWHGIMQGPDNAKRRRVLAAVRGNPKGRVDPKGIRLTLSGLISELARQLDCPVREPEIRALFDGIERVRRGTIDGSLPESPEAFSKAIQRHRADWNAIVR